MGSPSVMCPRKVWAGDWVKRLVLLTLSLSTPLARFRVRPRDGNDSSAPPRSAHRLALPAPIPDANRPGPSPTPSGSAVTQAATYNAPSSLSVPLPLPSAPREVSMVLRIAAQRACCDLTVAPVPSAPVLDALLTVSTLRAAGAPSHLLAASTDSL